MIEKIIRYYKKKIIISELNDNSIILEKWVNNEKEKSFLKNLFIFNDGSIIIENAIRVIDLVTLNNDPNVLTLKMDFHIKVLDK